MTERTTDIPEDIRSREVRTDPKLNAEEKEFRMVVNNTEDYCSVSTEIPTFIKWLQSIEDSSFEWVRVDSEGCVIGCSTQIPKGVVKLQATSRKFNYHSQMVSYGDQRDNE